MSRTVVVDLSAAYEVVCGAADEIQARGPHAALPQLVVEEFEERAHTILFTQPDEALGDGEELLDVEIAFDRGQPVRFYCVDVTARQAVLSALRDPHAVAGAARPSVERARGNGASTGPMMVSAAAGVERSAASEFFTEYNGAEGMPRWAEAAK